MKKLLIVLAIVFAATSISSCHTMHGFGEDLGILGEKIKGKSDK